MLKAGLAVAAAAIVSLAGLTPHRAAAAVTNGAKLPPALGVVRPEPAACQGWGRFCGPGFVRACGPYRCWCRPCH